MTFVDHLKGVRGEDLFLEVAFGRHMITGDLTKSEVTGSDPTHVVTVQHMLGGQERATWLALVPADRVALSCESLRVTTRKTRLPNSGTRPQNRMRPSGCTSLRSHHSRRMYGRL